MFTLPTIKDFIAQHNLQPQKKLGQNFLLDDYISEKIVSALPNISGKYIVEVGPGPGALTRAILNANPAHLYALELDSRAVAALKTIEPFFNNFTVIEADAMRYDIASLSNNNDMHLLANLPYNIGTNLVLDYIAKNYFSTMTVMLQKEVVERIVSAPNSKTFGKLSVLVQAFYEVHYLFDVEPEFFFPPPKVTSSVLHLQKRVNAIDLDFASLSKFLDRLFTNKRKMLRTLNLSLPWEEADIDSSRRAESLSITEILNLFLLTQK